MYATLWLNRVNAPRALQYEPTPPVTCGLCASLVFNNLTLIEFGNGGYLKNVAKSLFYGKRLSSTELKPSRLEHGFNLKLCK